MRLKSCLHCQGEIVGQGLQRLCAECVKGWKWCSRCESLKRVDEFGVLRSGKRYPMCRTCHNAYGREQRATTGSKEYHYRYHLQRKLGISREQAARLAAITACEVCGAEPDERLHIDHNHGTGAVRGALCRRCNYAVAVLEADVGWVEKMQEYLARYGAAADGVPHRLPTRQLHPCR